MTITGATATITMFLPWPAAELSPNARGHWSRKAKATRKAKADAWAIACEAKANRVYSERIAVSVTFLPPDHRRRDLDNCVGLFKAAADGIAMALGIDDSKWTVTYGWGDVVPDGAVRVQIAAIEERDAA